jgi:hypothetical protein
MIGSSVLLAGRLSSSPAHRAAALLRAALLRSAAASPKSILSSPKHPWISPEIAPSRDAVSELFEGPVRVTYPHSLAARLGALSLDEEAFTGQRDLASGETLLAQDAEFLDDFPRAENAKAGADSLPRQDGAPPEPAPRLSAADLRTLVREFQRRQRHASLLCAGGLASAFLFAVGGLLLLASFLPEAAAVPAKPDELVPHKSAPAPKRATSIAWHQQAREDGFIGLQFAYMRARAAAKAVGSAPRKKEM